jgi:hypothetical protein
MASKGSNDRLARLMREAGFGSHKAFARAVLEESVRIAGPFKRCDHTDVSRWLNGMTPRGQKPAVIAATISRRLGRRVTVADIGMSSGAVASSPDLGLSYPQAEDSIADTVTGLWHADLDQATALVSGNVDPTSWGDASLRWLVTPGNRSPTAAATGPRIGLSDLERFKMTVDMFVQLDNRFGGGHARESLIQYLATDGERLLHGQFTEDVGKHLFSAVAEATLLAAWMSYDSAPTKGLAQRYFIQALALAQAGEDRLLGASILDAMSHQATFVGNFGDAANLARAARTGTQDLATPTLRAHFYAMEARALARLGDAHACDIALSNAVREFERRNPEEDPEWIRYFDDAELAAEFGHCFRDLGRPVDATRYADQCLGTIDDGVYLRSDFFATMVLADAYLDGGEVEKACSVALDALNLGEQLRSARCVSYLREFRERLINAGPTTETSDFDEHARTSRLWRIASLPADRRPGRQ